MELSVCIPIYNADVNQLVLELLKQLESSTIDFEINLLDDSSKESYQLKNQSLKSVSDSIIYQELSENVGRSKIRNRLANQSNGDYLLFLDSDVKIDNKDFINNYLSIVKNSAVILACGGYQYPEELKQEGQELRYLYGKQVEEIKLVDSIPQSPFLGGNFLVHRSVFDKIQFDETIEKYGFEDLLFSLDFEREFGKETMIVFNPIQISSIDKNEDYLLKTRDAMENLTILYHQGKILQEDNLRILIAYNQLKSNGLLPVVTTLAKTSMPLLLFNLTSNNPKLKFFQFFKLLHFASKMRQLTDLTTKVF